MSARKPRDYFRTNSALSDWLTAASPASRTAIITEDLDRARRLSVLHEVTGLPIPEAWHFSGSQIAHADHDFREFSEAAHGAYAVRAIPRENKKDVIRNRNLPVSELVRWLQGRVGDIEKYDLEFSPHLTNEWATSFAVTRSGIIAEVVRGSLRQLTQGEHLANGPVRIVYDYGTWSSDQSDSKAMELAKTAISYSEVSSHEDRERLREELGCEFAHEKFIRGYFEAVFGTGDEIRFIDFNMSIGAPLEESYVEIIRSQQKDASGELRGITASRGHSAAIARVLTHDEDVSTDFGDGEILVCGEPTPDMIPLLGRASGVIMERGGLLAHASVVCRELRIPCLINTTNATEAIPDGAVVELDADAGVVRIIGSPTGNADASL